MIANLAILILTFSVTPLTDFQKEVLAVEVDHSQLENQHLRILLENVATWGDTLDESITQVPDYPKLYADSDRYRGDVFLIEGRFAGRARSIDLRHVGVWGDTLTEWVLVVNDDPEEVAVVYLIDVHYGGWPTPKTGSHVRTVGRFYKVWHDRDQTGQPTEFLTFIAGPVIVEGGWQRTGPSPVFPVLLLTMGLAAVYILIRIQIRHRTHKPRQEAMLSDQPAAALSDDPAAALQRMAGKQHDP